MLRETRARARLALALFCFFGLLAEPATTTSSAMNTPRLTPLSFGGIAGWKNDDLSEALSAFVRSCSEILEKGRGFSRQALFGGQSADWAAVCNDVAALGPHVSPHRARQFFESRFKPYRVHDAERPAGLFTGYFEPEVLGDLYRHDEFTVPIYARPPDLVAFDGRIEERTGLRYGRLRNGAPQPYFTRREIEQGALAGKNLEIVWLKSWADAFFMHVQGSGRVKLPGGEILRLAYAAKSGLPYTSIGGVLVKRGEIEPARMSMQTILLWMDEHPNKARELMWENNSFVFFRRIAIEDPSLGPPGAQEVGLTPLRSLAVDRGFWAYGTPLWLETELPTRDPGGSKAFSRLMIAQDTGSAIKGALRGDVFFGSGDDAIFLAGNMKSHGRMIALLPHELARKFDGSDTQ